MKKAVRGDSSAAIVLPKTTKTMNGHKKSAASKQRINNYDHVTIMAPVLEPVTDPRLLSAAVRNAMRAAAKRQRK